MLNSVYAESLIYLSEINGSIAEKVINIKITDGQFTIILRTDSLSIMFCFEILRMVVFSFKDNY